MADTDESQASGSDYPDAQELIHIRQKEPYKVHVCATSTRRKSARSKQKNAAPEKSSHELNSTCKSSAASAVILLDSSDSDMWVFISRIFHRKNLCHIS